MHLADAAGNATPWRPGRLSAARGGVEVYRSEAMELRRGDRVRFTRNDPASGLANGKTATVESVGREGVVFRLDDGNIAKLGQTTTGSGTPTEPSRRWYTPPRAGQWTGS